MKLNIAEDIIPGKSLGGIMLGIPVIDLQDELTQYAVKLLPNRSYELVNVFEARYSLAGGTIELAVDVRNGKIFKVCALKGYEGKLFGKLCVGMPVQEAMSIEPRLYYDEAEELLKIHGVEGVTLDVPEIDPEPDTVPSMLLSAICVEIPELMSINMQRGI